MTAEPVLLYKVLVLVIKAVQETYLGYLYSLYFTLALNYWIWTDI